MMSFDAPEEKPFENFVGKVIDFKDELNLLSNISCVFSQFEQVLNFNG